MTEFSNLVENFRGLTDAGEELLSENSDQLSVDTRLLYVQLQRIELLLRVNNLHLQAITGIEIDEGDV